MASKTSPEKLTESSRILLCHLLLVPSWDFYFRNASQKPCTKTLNLS